MKEILLNIESKELRAASMRNGILHRLNVERKSERRLTGNIYLGRVATTLKNIQSAFIDIKESDNGFIHLSDILENKKKFEQIYDMEFEWENSAKAIAASSSDPKDIQEVMKPGQTVLVQVIKEPIGNKGARLTSNISIAGRYLVLLPNSPHRGVSRKISHPSRRDYLKRFLRSMEMPEAIGLICRTASMQASDDALFNEAKELLTTWQTIVDQVNISTEPRLLFAESDFIKNIVMEAINKRFNRLLVDDYATYQACKRLYAPYSGEHSMKIELYRDRLPMFERFQVEREIEKTLRKKVWLPSGGYLYFEHTEAMHTIDVNSGRSSINQSEVEESIVRINLEAADEIARQLPLRNAGGLIICDFIDMRLKKNQKRIVEHLRELMKEDSEKCTVLDMNEFGLVPVTRKRTSGTLKQLLYSECPYCSGSGTIKSQETSSIELERAVKKAVLWLRQNAFRILIHPALYDYLAPLDVAFLTEFAENHNAKISWATDPTLHLNDFQLVSTVNGQRIEV